jgi:cysteine desulfurase
VNVKGISYLPCSAHKFYGPKGVGALYINKDINTRTMRPIIHGGSQEKGLRSGTHNVPGIVGLGKACQIATEQLTISNTRIGKLRDILESQLLSIPGAVVNGSTRCRLPNTCNISFQNVEGQLVIEALGKEIALATGSACNADLIEPSHVLRHMGLSPERILGSLRISLGRFNSEEEVDLARERLTKVITELSLI